MQNVGNELRSIAMTKVAQAYLCHRINDNVLKLSDSPPLDPLLQDLWLILLTPKIFIREGARELNIRLDGDIQLNPSYFHHTRRYGYLTVYESFLFSNKVETYLQMELYGEIAQKPQRSAARVIESWSDRLDLDPSWPEKTIRTYRNHLKGQYPVLVA
jgi:hypothetical protein